MRLAHFLLSLAIAACGCTMQAPPPSPFADAGQLGAVAGAQAPAGALAGGRFTARTDGGEARPLTLRHFSARVTTRPGTVRTHLTLEVAGPAQERVEALLRIRVPRGAAVTRAVLWVDGRPRNGAFVERDRAREVYRSIVSRRRDPALVTWDGPEWVAVSIFPVERGEARRLELEWVEAAAMTNGEVQLRVPVLADDGKVVGRASLEVDGRPVRTDSRDVVAISPAPTTAAQVVAARAPGDPFQRILVRGGAPEGPAQLVLLAETSAAMTPPDRANQRTALEAVLGALPGGARVTLLAVDWQATALAESATPAEAERALEKLDAIASAGALHLERALTEAATRAARDKASVLFVGRGLDGFGGDAIRRPLAALCAAATRLAVVATSEVPAPLADAAGLTGGEAVPASGLGLALPAMLANLGPRPAQPALASRGVESWHALDTADGHVAWVGRALGAASLSEAGAPAFATGDADDLTALWERARLDRGPRDGGVSAARPARAVLTPLRSLLVLESDADYARFGLAAPEPLGERETPAEKAPDLSEGKMGLRAPRDNPDPAVARRLAEEHAKNAGILGVLGGSALRRDAEESLGLNEQIAEAYGSGGLALIGSGSGGGGTGESTMGLGNLGTIGALAGRSGNGWGYSGGAGGVGSRRAAPEPDVIPGQLVVRGALDKEIIRRIVRRHLNEVKYCYEQELVRQPGLQGRIVVQFTIAHGRVLASVLQTSTIGAPRVESCIVQTVRRWEFPQAVGSGLVSVSSPFVLTPGPGQPPARQVDALHAVDGDPDHAAREALTVLGSREPLADRVQRVTELLGLDRTRDPETAAWLVDRSWASLDELLVVARLLVIAHRTPDAIRVLSERAQAEPRPVAAELHRIGAEADAAEVTALSRR